MRQQKRSLGKITVVGLSLLMIAVSFPAAGAEIYTFGKRGDGTRYVKQVDRPQQKTEAPANPEKPNGSPNADKTTKRPGKPYPYRSPAPPPDNKTLELLDNPI